MTTYPFVGTQPKSTTWHQSTLILGHNQIQQHDNNLPPTRTQPKSETSQHTCSWDTTKFNNMTTTDTPPSWDTTKVNNMTTISLSPGIQSKSTWGQPSPPGTQPKETIWGQHPTPGTQSWSNKSKSRFSKSGQYTIQVTIV